MDLGLRISSLKEHSSIAMEIDTKETLAISLDKATDLTNTQTNHATKECGRTTKRTAKVTLI
jgi:hypothetical protein